MSDAGEEMTSEREEILEVLANRIRTIQTHLEENDPEPDDMEAQRLQIKWTRTLGYLAGQYRQLMKDTDLDEMEEDIDLLQEVAEAKRR